MSVSRYCHFYLAVDESWYMELSDGEYEDGDEATTYGPFSSLEQAEKYLDDEHSNPGGYSVDDSGKTPAPTKSPNGRMIVAPFKRGWRS